MKFILALLVVLASAGMSGGADRQHGDTSVVLPDVTLMQPCAARCSHLWLDAAVAGNRIYPVNVIIDSSNTEKCPRGIVALYDKSVTLSDIQKAVDQHYGRWARHDNTTLPVKLWRVEPEKISIQLATVDAENEQHHNSTGLRRELSGLEKGMKQVIYLRFTGTQCECR